MTMKLRFQCDFGMPKPWIWTITHNGRLRGVESIRAYKTLGCVKRSARAFLINMGLELGRVRSVAGYYADALIDDAEVVK